MEDFPYITTTRTRDRGNVAENHHHRHQPDECLRSSEVVQQQMSVPAPRILSISTRSATSPRTATMLSKHEERVFVADAGGSA